jgi:hypothetical protein
MELAQKNVRYVCSSFAAFNKRQRSLNLSITRRQCVKKFNKVPCTSPRQL